MDETITASDKWVYALVRAMCAGARLLPESACRVLGYALGTAAFWADGRHRRLSLINLAYAYGPGADPLRLERIARRNFQQWGMIALEWAAARSFFPGPADPLRNRVSFAGIENLRRAKAGGRPVVLLSAHFGNWEYGHLAYASRIGPLTFIVRRIDNLLVEAERLAYNRRYGVDILYKETGLRAAVKGLRQGRDLVIFADQKANRTEGIDSRFFNRPTTTLPIVAALARKYRCPVVPMFTVRRGWSAKHRVVFLPALYWRHGDDTASFTLRQNRVIEAMIRRHPDHWLWLHRKWRTDRPEIYQAADWRSVAD